MIVPLALLLGILAVPLIDGDLRRLGDLEVRLPWCAAFALLAQVVLFEVVDDHITAGWAAVLHLATYVPAVAFVVANRRWPGIAVAALGAGLNIVAIVANHGVMPASAWARDVAGIERDEEVTNAAELDDPNLLVLGDVLAVPGPWPIGAAFSVGDLLLVVGGVVLVHRVCRREGSADADDLDPQGVAVGGGELDGLAGLGPDERRAER